MSFRFVPRSAVGIFDPEAESRAMQARSMPAVRGGPPRMNPAPTVSNAMPVLQRLQAENQRLKQENVRIRGEANAKLGALVNRVRQLEGFIRAGYAPNAQPVPATGQADVAVPTHTLRNPNLYTSDGGRGAPPAQAAGRATAAGNPRDAAGAPNNTAQDAAETVRSAEDAIFYGEGDAAFYQGED